MGTIPIVPPFWWVKWAISPKSYQNHATPHQPTQHPTNPPIKHIPNVMRVLSSHCEQPPVTTGDASTNIHCMVSVGTGLGPKAEVLQSAVQIKTSITPFDKVTKWGFGYLGYLGPREWVGGPSKGWVGGYLVLLNITSGTTRDSCPREGSVVLVL